MPSSTGMCRSISTTSGRSSAARSQRLARRRPPRRRPRSPARTPSSVASASRNSAWSSTSSTRTGVTPLRTWSARHAAPRSAAYAAPGRRRRTSRAGRRRLGPLPQPHEPETRRRGAAGRPRPSSRTSRPTAVVARSRAARSARPASACLRTLVRPSCAARNSDSSHVGAAAGGPVPRHRELGRHARRRRLGGERLQRLGQRRGGPRARAARATERRTSASASSACSCALASIGVGRPGRPASTARAALTCICTTVRWCPSPSWMSRATRLRSCVVASCSAWAA